jgi:hypothetical protein
MGARVLSLTGAAAKLAWRLVRGDSMSDDREPRQLSCGEPASYLDIPPERCAAALAQAASLAATAAAVALELPLSADVDDFRRLLVAEARS